MTNDISEALRAAVAQRAGRRCEYCLIPEEDAGFPHQVDHIVSRKHGGLSTSDNLAYACILCNRHKGTDIGSVDSHTGELVRLFHPRQDRRTDHFRLQGAVIEPVSIVGEATARLLRWNAPERIGPGGRPAGSAQVGAGILARPWLFDDTPAWTGKNAHPTAGREPNSARGSHQKGNIFLCFCLGAW